MRRLLICVLAGLTLGGCSHTAGSGKPPAPLVEASPVYATQVSLGPCLGDGESVLGTAFMTAVISTGVNRIGAAIKSAAASQTTTALARRNIEISNRGPLGPCVYVARGWFHNDRPTFADEGERSRSAYIVPEGSSFVYDDPADTTALWLSGLYLASTPDFFFQGRLNAAEANRAYTVVPTLAWLRDPLVANQLRSDDRNVLLSFAVVPLDKPASLEKGGSTVVLGHLTPGELREFSQETCVGRIEHRESGPADARVGVQRSTNCAGDPEPEDYTVLRTNYESEWFAVGLTPERQPMTLLALVSETRSASAFLGYVSDVFTAVQAPLATALGNELIPATAEAVAEAETTASEALLTAYDTAYGTAATALGECVTSPAVAAKRTAARVALRNLIAAARRAGIAVPNISSLTISADGDDPAACSTARAQMESYAPGGVSRLGAS